MSTGITHSQPLSAKDLKTFSKVKSDLALKTTPESLVSVFEHQGNYNDFKYVSSGGFKTVLRAHKIDTDEDVVIALQRKKVSLQHEVKQQKLLNDKLPNVAPLLIESHKHKFKNLKNKTVYRQCVVSEYRGKDLFKTFVGSKRLISNEAFYTLTQKLVLYLEKIDKLGFVHRDIKPANILTTTLDCSNITVVDFGDLSKLGSKSEIYTDTRYYRSPETLFKVNTLSLALFSLGTTLYTLYTKELLFASPVETTIENISIAYQLQAVLSFSGPPTKQFMKKVDKKTKKIFFKETDNLKDPRLLKLCKERTVYMKNPKKYLFTKIHRAAKERGGCPKEQKALAKKISSFIYRLVNFNGKARTMSSILKHPFLKG